MQINPGGRLQPEDVVGRDREVARYWEILDRQGLVSRQSDGSARPTFS